MDKVVGKMEEVKLKGSCSPTVKENLYLAKHSFVLHTYMHMQNTIGVANLC